MLRTICAEPTLWDAILPEQCLGLPPGLAEVDRLLDDPRFFEPFRPFFSPRRGRPSIPMEWFLRLMFLRFRYKLGYELVTTRGSSHRHCCCIRTGGQLVDCDDVREERTGKQSRSVRRHPCARYWSSLRGGSTISTEPR